MTRYLLDTNIASALAPGRADAGEAESRLVTWLMSHEPRNYLSVITILEIESGVQQLARAGSTRRRSELSGWLAGLFATFGERILPVDGRVAMAAGRLEATAISKGQRPGLADVIIAATGEVHDLTILTRNIRHFAPLGAPSLNPYAIRPQEPG